MRVAILVALLGLSAIGNANAQNIENDKITTEIVHRALSANADPNEYVQGARWNAYANSDGSTLVGFASHTGDPASETYRSIIIWMEFTYRTGIGEIPAETRLLDVPVEGFLSVHPWRMENVGELLIPDPPQTVGYCDRSIPCWTSKAAPPDIKARSLGVLLRLLQSVVKNVAWIPVKDRAAPIVDHFWVRGDGGTTPPPLSDDRKEFVINRGVDLMRLAQRHEPWENVKKFLDTFFFEFKSLDAPAQRWKGK